MNSENSKTSDTHKILLGYVAASDLSIYYTCKNI